MPFTSTYRGLRRLLLAGVFLLIAGAWPFAQGQGTYPNRPIQLIVPYPPGGSVDALARVIGQKLAESVGQPVVIENRPGGNTVIGTAAVSKAAPDGHTLLLTASTHVINVALGMKQPYDSFKDFVPVSTVIKSDFILVVNSALPVDNVQQLVALAKARPGQLNYGTSSVGNSNHLAAELFSQITGTQLHHVPYKGAVQAITDVIGGRVEIFFSVPANVLPHIASGKLKALATTAKEPLPGVGPVPTFAQAGVPNFNVESWQGILAPAGTPKPIVDFLATHLTRIVAQPDVREKLMAQGQQPFSVSGEKFAELMRADLAMYSRIVKTANIKLEE
jgi:tripartite-type tricarboxylate transporter receptor subunit TctC